MDFAHILEILVVLFLVGYLIYAVIYAEKI